ncbi:MAG: hypothetical protein IH899_15475, partial [Planctomycetes bacterium]|nr:hypothetical protein [Planctomycetota bacterium]
IAGCIVIWQGRACGAASVANDMGGGILTKEIATGRVVTVAVKGMTFHHPVQVGHVVCCHGRDAI